MLLLVGMCRLYAWSHIKANITAVSTAELDAVQEADT
jgi:hypothetical protein